MHGRREQKTQADSMLKGIKRRRVINKRCPVGGRTSKIDFHSFSTRHSRAVYPTYVEVRRGLVTTYRSHGLLSLRSNNHNQVKYTAVGLYSQPLKNTCEGHKCLGSVSSRECLDTPAILARIGGHIETLTAGD